MTWWAWLLTLWCAAQLPLIPLWNRFIRHCKHQEHR